MRSPLWRFCFAYPRSGGRTLEARMSSTTASSDPIPRALRSGGRRWSRGHARIEVRPQRSQAVEVSFRPLYVKSAVKNAQPACPPKWITPKWDTALPGVPPFPPSRFPTNFRPRVPTASRSSRVPTAVFDATVSPINLVIGTGARGDEPDGDPLKCQLSRPHRIFAESDGTHLIGETENHPIRVLRP